MKKIIALLLVVAMMLCLVACNGRVGHLLLFKECLRNNIVPFIIEDDIKMFYYRGLKEWQNERGYLRDTCLAAQDRFKKYLDYFRVPYDK